MKKPLFLLSVACTLTVSCSPKNLEQDINPCISLFTGVLSSGYYWESNDDRVRLLVSKAKTSEDGLYDLEVFRGAKVEKSILRAIILPSGDLKVSTQYPRLDTYNSTSEIVSVLALISDNCANPVENFTLNIQLYKDYTEYRYTGMHGTFGDHMVIRSSDKGLQITSLGM